MDKHSLPVGSVISYMLSALAVIGALWCAAYYPQRIEALPTRSAETAESPAVDAYEIVPVGYRDGHLLSPRSESDAGFPADAITVPPSELYDLPPARDAISALEDPPVLRAGEAGWLEDEDMVLAVTLYDRRRAYPRTILARHCLINDRIAGQPVLVYFDPPSGAAMAFTSPTYNNQPLTFGVSGIGYGGAGLPYDRATQSLWYPLTGRAITGPLAAETTTLKPIHAEWMTWGAWKEIWPDTTVLSRETGQGYDYGQDPYTHVQFGADGDTIDYYHSDLLLAPPELSTAREDIDDKTEILGIRLPKGSVAVPVEEALAAAGEEAAVFTHATSWGDLVVTVDPSAGRIHAELPGNWRPLQMRMFWFAWHAAHPETKVWHIGGTGDESE
ncbi:MAG: DUF3179 domain-containing (seleno)protein [Armatimonadota bacterium]